MNEQDYAKWVDSIWMAEGEIGIRDHAIMGIGLPAEAGEAADHVKKFIRDGKMDRAKFLAELGDTHYYFVKILNTFGFTMDDVRAANIAKLEDRKARGVMRGTGDDR